MRPLVPDYIETLKPYVPGKPISETRRELGLSDVIKLASNENPLGPCPGAAEAIRQAADFAHLYPDGASFELVGRLAAFHGIDRSSIVVGSGSNEILELVIRTFTEHGDEGVVSAGSFLIYKLALQAHGRTFREVPMRKGLGYDLVAIGDALGPKTRLIFLANPDNPTGTIFTRGELSSLLARVPGDCLVVLDEAYVDYVESSEFPDGMAFLSAHPNLIVLRTFSKAYGLAGVRLGYGVMHPKLSGYLHRTRMPFNVSSVAQAAGIAALEDQAHVQRSRQIAREGVHYLTVALGRLGIRLTQSEANFVFADFGRPAAPIYQALLSRGVITRPIPAYGFPNALRISAGLPEHNQRLVRELESLPV